MCQVLNPCHRSYHGLLHNHIFMVLIVDSYIVCCMFEEAASLAASVIKQMCTTTSIKVLYDTELVEMMESAGMVYVQSLKELGRYGISFWACFYFMGVWFCFFLSSFCLGSLIKINLVPCSTHFHLFLHDSFLLQGNLGQSWNLMCDQGGRPRYV